MPLILARLYEEDITFQANMPTSYRISPMSKVKKVELPESTTIENQTLEYRNNAQRTSSMKKEEMNQLRLLKGTTLKFEEEFKHEQTTPTKNQKLEKDKLMWSKDKRHSSINFKDFELLSIIGKGTFGKIYLV